KHADHRDQDDAEPGPDGIGYADIDGFYYHGQHHRGSQIKHHDAGGRQPLGKAVRHFHAHRADYLQHDGHTQQSPTQHICLPMAAPSRPHTLAGHGRYGHTTFIGPRWHFTVFISLAASCTHLSMAAVAVTTPTAGQSVQQFGSAASKEGGTKFVAPLLPHAM